MNSRDVVPAASGSRRTAILVLAYWLPVVAYIAVIFSVSSVNGKNIPNAFPNMDKFAHLLEYSLLGLLLGRAIRFTMTGRGRVAASIATIVVGALVGMSDEIYQRGVPNRHSDIRDWLTDVAALSVSVAFTQWVTSRSLRRRAAVSTGDETR